MNTQKEIARSIDQIAFGGTATSKQIWFIAGLYSKLGATADEIATDFMNEYRLLSKARASAIISELLSQVEAVA